jgi:putative resolvase
LIARLIKITGHNHQHRKISSGKIDSVRVGTGKRLYNNNQIKELFGVSSKHGEALPKKKIIYARVSSDHQREALERQAESLREYYPNHELIKDVGSGINFKRKGFLSILEQVESGLVSEVVVTDKE